MTRQEAQAEAVRRWGDSGCVHAYKDKGKQVYEVCGGWGLEHYGSGYSWEQAFASVDAENDVDARSSR